MSMKWWGILSILLAFVVTGCSNQDGTNASEDPVSEPVTEETEEQEVEEENQSSTEEQETEEAEEDSSVSSFEVSAPEVSAPEVEAPEVHAPEVSAPEVTVTWNEEEIKMEVPDHLLFDFDKSSLREDSIVLLEDISGEMKQYETADVKIHGHTDNQGDASYNKKLSEERAQAVKNFFLDQEELEPFHFTTKGFGEEQPLVPNDSEENREKNRRVEILIKPDEA